MSKYHTSVLLHETIQYLEVKEDCKYIDATLGGGGHSFEILKQGGRVLGLDVDQEAIDFIRFKIQDLRFKNNLIVAKGNFRDIDVLARNNGFEQVSGIIYDLGVSSHQLDSIDRGFSFTHEAPLDMRMDKDLQIKALDLLKVLSKGELYALFTKFGEESNARRIAENIIESRRIKPIETTTELAAIVSKSVKLHKPGFHPATRVFQALRIAVNDELRSLEESLSKAVSLLTFNGRIAVISFHSLEDRIVKHTFLDWERKGTGQIITKKPIVPNEEEISANPRSRSAKMRVFEKN